MRKQVLTISVLLVLSMFSVLTWQIKHVQATPITSGTLIEYIQNLISLSPTMINTSISDPSLVLEAYAVGNISMVQLQTYVDSLPTSNLDGSNVWLSRSAFYILLIEKQCAKLDGFVQNATTINWALNNITVMANGLPENFNVSNTFVFQVYGRFIFYWYKWVADNAGDTVKWNLTKAFDNLEHAVFVHTAHPIVNYIKSDDTTSMGNERYYDEAAETMDCFLQIHALNSTAVDNDQVLTDAKDVWDYIVSTFWVASPGFFRYTDLGNDWECEAGGFLKIAFKLFNVDLDNPNITLSTTDVVNRFLAKAWYSPQWVNESDSSKSTHVVTHGGLDFDSERRLQNTVMAWSVIYGVYRNLTEPQRANITKMLTGYSDGSGTYLPAWQYLYHPNAILYDNATGLFSISSLSYDGSAESQALALGLLTYFGIVPQTGSLAIPVSEDTYEDTTNFFDDDLCALDISNRILTMSVATSGIFTFQYGSTPFNYTFTPRGTYNVTFASDWNSITSAQRLSDLPNNQIFFADILSDPPVIVSITYPTNTTYNNNMIPVYFTASDGYIDKEWYNCKNGTDWVYVSNQTGNSGTFIGFVDGTYTGYFWANNTDGIIGVATVMFSVSIIGGTTQIIINVWWSSWW